MTVLNEASAQRVVNLFTAEMQKLHHYKGDESRPIAPTQAQAMERALARVFPELTATPPETL